MKRKYFIFMIYEQKLFQNFKIKHFKLKNLTMRFIDFHVYILFHLSL